MKTLFFSLCLFACSAATIRCHGQINDSLNMEQPGAKLPDISINRIRNFNKTAAKLSDFNGKLLIIDFWATWCAPCVTMIPVMDSLQRVFKGQVMFLSVTSEPDAVVNPFLTKLKTKKGFSSALSAGGIAEVTGDTLLHNMFPHHILPHYIWIKDGVVKAITGYEAVNSLNIHSVIGDQPIRLDVKKDKVVSYDIHDPLFYTDLVREKNTLMQTSVITGVIDGIQGGYQVDLPSGDTSHSMARITGRNLTIPLLFQLANRDAIITNDNRMIVEAPELINDERKIGIDNYLNWMKDGHAFCYEIIVPRRMKDKALIFMRQDLARFFPEYEAVIEKRMVPCLALTRTSGIDKLKTKGGKPAVMIDRFGIKLQSCYLRVLIGRLFLYMQNLPPMVDDTGYPDMTDMDVEFNPGSVIELNASLEKYDLKFVEKPMSIDMLVVRKRKLTQ